MAGVLVVIMMVMGRATPELYRFVGHWAVWLDTSKKLLCSRLVTSKDGTRAFSNLDRRSKAKRVVGGKRHVVQIW
jgi:hypothetical protein